MIGFVWQAGDVRRIFMGCSLDRLRPHHRMEQYVCCRSAEKPLASDSFLKGQGSHDDTRMRRSNLAILSCVVVERVLVLWKRLCADPKTMLPTKAGRTFSKDRISIDVGSKFDR